jgi:hypothetical protein
LDSGISVDGNFNQASPTICAGAPPDPITEHNRQLAAA